MEGDGKFEFQISTDETKSWFDSVRACKVNTSFPYPPITGGIKPLLGEEGIREFTIRDEMKERSCEKLYFQ